MEMMPWLHIHVSQDFYPYRNLNNKLLLDPLTLKPGENKTRSEDF